METALTSPHLNVEKVGQVLESAGFCSDGVLILAVKHYFTLLRQEKGHHPDASPMDLEILLILKLIAVGCNNPVQILKQVGIIIVVINDEYCIAINNALLLDILCSSRSRINNTLKRLNWEMITMSNNVKYTTLKQLLDRSDVRFWTLRKIPIGSAMYDYVTANSSVVSGTQVDAQFSDPKSNGMEANVTNIVDFA